MSDTGLLTELTDVIRRHLGTVATDTAVIDAMLMSLRAGRAVRLERIDRGADPELDRVDYALAGVMDTIQKLLNARFDYRP